MKSKKGFELSINFIVMLVLAITVFGFGLYFARQVFTEAGNIKADLDKSTEDNVRSLLDRGERVAIPFPSKDIKSGDLATFGLGILNVEGSDKTFSININCTSGVSNGQKEILDACSGVQLIPTSKSAVIKNNEQLVIPIAIQVPGSKPQGTYIFTITVMVDNANYVPPKQVYVNIV